MVNTEEKSFSLPQFIVERRSLTEVKGIESNQTELGCPMSNNYVVGGECRDSSLLKMLRTGNCWVCSIKHGLYAIPLMDQAILQKDPEDREMGGLCNAVAQTFQAGTLKSCSSFHNTGPGNGQSRMRKDSMESYPSWLLMGSGGGEEYLILRRPSIGSDFSG